MIGREVQDNGIALPILRSMGNFVLSYRNTPLECKVPVAFVTHRPKNVDALRRGEIFGGQTAVNKVE